ncbi:MAG TPA: metallophosphoesterase [Pirellulaceae bacterium]|jgi:hypothetical protein|nr:metallophosphoesterase [Pirellulaceae bacterium]
MVRRRALRLAVSDRNLVMLLAWVSDLHFENAEAPDAVEAIVDAWNRSAADAVVCTGDIAEGALLLPTLAHIDKYLTKPLYFVLGNHDFYDGSIEAIRREVAALARGSRRLNYLTAEDPAFLNARTALVGDDGWSDGRVGSFLGSDVTMRDYERIPELSDIDAASRAERLERLGRGSAERLRPKLEAAFASARTVLVATHVPPYREACRYKGYIADDCWAPHFVCGSVGEALTEAALARPDRRIETYCGHCHHAGLFRPLPNLSVYASGACYQDAGKTRLIAC